MIKNAMLLLLLLVLGSFYSKGQRVGASPEYIAETIAQ